VIENNGFGLSMPASEATGAEELVHRAAGYGMPGVVVDGDEVLAVHTAAEQAVNRARNGGGPSVIEARVTRWGAHADGVPELRTAEELAEARRRDCVPILREALIERGVLGEAEAAAIEDECRGEIEAAVEEGLSAKADAPAVVLTPEQAWELTYAS
jgi:TPP-dependent pyruvate/acetoin dehydrogenase alpha subunit